MIFRSLAAASGMALLLLLIFFSMAVAQTQTKKPAASPKSSTSQGRTAPSKAPAKEAVEEEQIPPAAPDALFPAVVARVNGKPVLGRDLEQRIQTQLAPLGNPKWNNLREDYRQELIAESLGSLIGTELVYQKAISIGVRATEPEIQAEFTRFSKAFPSDAQMNLALADRGLDRSGLSRELARSLTVAKFVEETIGKKISVTPAEVSQYYQQRTEEFRHPDMIQTSHILFMVPEGATEEQEKLTRQRAESVLARVKKGEDFSKLAREYSTDVTASRGGDLGMTPQGQLVPEYEDVAFALPMGGISDLVRTKFGYHIIKLTDKKKAGLATLAEVQQQLTEFLRSQKKEQELAKLIDQLRTQAKIVSYIPVGTQPPQAPTASSPRP